MFIKFVSVMILCGFVFRYLLLLISLPFVFLLTIFNKDDNKTSAMSAQINQVIISIVYAGMMAIIAKIYATQENVTYPLFYGIFGFLVTFFALGSNAYSKQKELGSRWTLPSATEMAAVEGAALGSFIGLVAFPLLYLWPQTIAIIPGSVKFFIWVFNTADWLTGYWIVRLILLISAAGFILNAGFIALMGGFMLWFAIIAWFKKLIGVKETA